MTILEHLATVACVMLGAVILGLIQAGSRFGRRRCGINNGKMSRSQHDHDNNSAC